MTSQGLRAIAFSYTNLSKKQYFEIKNQENYEQLLFERHTFIALVALEDPLREAAARFIDFAKSGDINVRMITGDNLDTAKKYALDCGILTAD